MSIATNHLYEFGIFSLDPGQRLLLREGNPVPLTPKAFDLLVVMVEQNGQLLFKDQLMSTVWPGVSVEEGNLVVTVSHLRKALGDDRGKHEYIETVSKRGYRFVAPVVERIEPVTSTAHPAENFVDDPALEVVHDEILDVPMDVPMAVAQSKVAISFANWRVLALAAVLIGTMVMIGRLIGNKRSILAAVDASSVKSLAVMPFEMIGVDKGDEYLGLGTADALITRLSNTGKILVRPTSAIEKYLNTSVSPEQAGKEQKVDAILNGRIQRDGNRIRMTVQMVRVRDGAQLWAQTYDQVFTSAFNLEDEVSERVAQSIRLQLTDKEHQRFIKRPTDNPEAYNAFVRGRYYWNKRTKEGMTKGLDYFREAISIDPNFSEAYEGVADSYAALGLYAAIPPEQAFPAARDAAHKALQMNEDLADAQATLGMIDFYYDWNGPASQNEFQRAFDSNPNYVMAHSWNAESLAAMGRFPEATAEARRAIEEDPLSLIVNSNAGWTFCLAGHFEEAVQTLQKAIDIDPNFPRTHFRLGEVYETRGMYDKAIDQLKQAVQLSGGDVYYLAGLGHAEAMSGKTNDARDILRSLQGMSDQQYVPAFAIAMVYVGLKDKENAMKWLQKASTDHSTSMAYLKVDPFFTSLNSDPRFQKLAQHINF